MASFASLDKRMGKDVDRLHEFLWHAKWKEAGERLLTGLAREAKELDGFLRLGGTLRRHAESLVNATRLDKDWNGPDLFELLHNAYHLTAAEQRLHAGALKRAAEHVAAIVESDSIGTCASVDAFHLVQEWEAGKSDFETYMGRLADALEGKGVAHAGQYKRMMLATRTFGREWDGKSPKAQQALEARAAVHGGAWCTLTTRIVRQVATGRPPRVPLKDYAAIVQAIVGRL